MVFDLVFRQAVPLKAPPEQADSAVGAGDEICLNQSAIILYPGSQRIDDLYLSAEGGAILSLALGN